MVRSVLFSVALLALLIFAVLKLQSSWEQRLAVERVTSVDIYADRIAYRTNVYATPTLLSYGLKAVNDPPRRVVLHTCSRMDDLEAVIDVVREQGYTDFQVEMPDSCHGP